MEHTAVMNENDRMFIFGGWSDANGHALSASFLANDLQVRKTANNNTDTSDKMLLGQKYNTSWDYD